MVLESELESPIELGGGGGGGGELARGCVEAGPLLSLLSHVHGTVCRWAHSFS